MSLVVFCSRWHVSSAWFLFLWPQSVCTDTPSSRRSKKNRAIECDYHVSLTVTYTRYVLSVQHSRDNDRAQSKAFRQKLCMHVCVLYTAHCRTLVSTLTIRRNWEINNKMLKMQYAKYRKTVLFIFKPSDCLLEKDITFGYMWRLLKIHAATKRAF